MANVNVPQNNRRARLRRRRLEMNRLIAKLEAGQEQTPGGDIKRKVRELRKDLENAR